MNRPIFKRVFPQALAWAGLVALCGVVALAQTTPVAPPPQTEVRTDGQIEMDVVHALDTSQALKNDLITAATIQGEVTLSGRVSSEASRGLAESLASHVPGVTKVNNNLKVDNPQDAQAAQEESNSQPDEGVPSQPDDQGQFRGQIHGDVQAQIQAQRQAQQQARAYATPNGPVTVPQGTLLQLRTSEPVNSKRAKAGEPVQFIVIHDVAIGNVLAIPRGATVHGVVTEIKRAGALKGSPELALTLTSLDMGGQSYPLDTSQFKVKGPGKGGRSANNMIGGTILGTIIGCAVRASLGLRGRRRSRPGRRYCRFSGYSRTGRLDSRRGAGGLPPEYPADGQPGERQRGSPPGAGALSRRPHALPARLLPLWPAVSVCLRLSLWLSAGLLPPVLRRGRVLLLAVKAWQSARRNAGIPEDGMPVVILEAPSPGSLSSIMAMNRVKRQLHDNCASRPMP